MRVGLHQLGYELAIPPLQQRHITRVRPTSEQAIRHLLQSSMDAEHDDDFRHLLVHLGEIDVASLTPEDVVARVADHISWGRVWVLRLRQYSAGTRASAEATEPAASERPRALGDDTEKELDFIDVLVTNGMDDPWADEEYIIHLPDGTIENGTLDGSGRLRLDDVPHGSFSLALPAIFDATVFRDGERQPEPGSGQPQPLPAPPVAAPSSTAVGLDGEDEDDDWDDHDDDDTTEGAWQDASAWAAFDDDAPFDGPSAHAFGVSDVEQCAEEFGYFDLHGLTGCEYQLATLHCISIRLLRPDGQWQREPIDFQLQRTGKETIASGTSQDGIIFVDDVAVGAYELVVGNDRYPLRSSPYARFYTLIHLITNPGGQ